MKYLFLITGLLLSCHGWGCGVKDYKAEVGKYLEGLRWEKSKDWVAKEEGARIYIEIFEEIRYCKGKKFEGLKKRIAKRLKRLGYTYKIPSKGEKK